MISYVVLHPVGKSSILFRFMEPSGKGWYILCLHKVPFSNQTYFYGVLAQNSMSPWQIRAAFGMTLLFCRIVKIEFFIDRYKSVIYTKLNKQTKFALFGRVRYLMLIWENELLNN